MKTSSASADGSLPSGVRPLREDDPAEIGGHTLVGRLGWGGMGIVYLGRDPQGGLVAVKAAHDEMTDDESVRRYTAEASCLRRAPSAYTVALLADGTTHVPPYLVTEYVQGRSLAHVVRDDGPLRGASLRALAIGVARALAAIHQAGLAHRDLKPANILLTSTGPRLIDFGIAQRIGDSGGPTNPGMVVGSPGWIPPERLNRLPATPASDVFGWGCVVAYAGTGRNPFGTGDPDRLARRIMHDPPDLDGLEDTLRAPVTQALHKDPAGRPASAELPAWLGWADHSSEPATETPASRQTVLPVGYATDEDMPRTGDQEPAPAVGAALVPLDRPEEPAAEDVDGRSGTKEIRVRRRGRAAAPVAMVATAAAALVTFLVTTGADNDGAPPAAPGGESSVPPPSPAAGHHARRPGSVPRSPVTHHTTAPDGGPRLVPEPTVRRVPRHSKAGGKGKGGTKAKGKRGPGG